MINSPYGDPYYHLGYRHAPLTRGRTWKTYMNSLRGTWSQEVLDYHDLMYRLATTNFKKLLLVPGFLGRFHKSEFHLQRMILERLEQGNCIWMTAMHLKLIHETNIDNRDLLQWVAVRPNDKDSVVWSAQEKRPSEEFEARIRDILNFIRMRSEPDGYISSHTVDFLTGMLLGVKHGEAKVTHILNMWIDQEVKNNYYDFVQTVENWDKVKEYPIEWGVSLIESHVCVERKDDGV